ncbi:MAG: glycerophosphodiester phosphodiesterase [Lachnospiraceae bacterium]|nr:glycerophosphodiester phosphodiesterase [Lachnospiraceae bacterium]
MLLLLFFLLLILLLLVFYIWAILPNFGRKTDCLHYADWSYAHRGLWDMDLQIPENSLPAFSRAVESGFAIELDVHLTKDKQLVVFHDDTLKRMCQLDEKVEEMTYDQISRYALKGTDYCAPLLPEVLELVNGRVPLLIEMKLPTRDLSLCPVLASLLDSYTGNYMIESFQPFGLRWFRKNRPEVLRGQLSARYKPSEPPALPLKIASTELLLNWISRPDFIAYNYRHYGSLGSILNARLFRTPYWVWTIRSEKAYATCKKRFDGVIFEKMLPEIPT